MKAREKLRRKITPNKLARPTPMQTFSNQPLKSVRNIQSNFPDLRLVANNKGKKLEFSQDLTEGSWDGKVEHELDWLKELCQKHSVGNTAQFSILVVAING